MRWWYLRRGVAWLPLLTCCALAGLLTLAVRQWPSTALVLLPLLLACCVCAAAFVFDERAASVVAVTPRGAGWRRTARLAVAVVPLAMWTAVVVVRPGDLPLDRGDWWLIGAAATLLTVGLAALASRREVTAPGSVLATGAALATLAPVIVTNFAGWDPVYPLSDFGTGVRGTWLGVAAAGCLACLVALRPGVRP